MSTASADRGDAPRGRIAKRETEATTRAETRYGCFLPDLTGLARDPSAVSLPSKLYQRAACQRSKRLHPMSNDIRKAPGDAKIWVAANADGRHWAV